MRDCSWVVGNPQFSNVRPDNFKCSSDSTEDVEEKYNCIAWAVGKKDAFWWPRQLGGYHWPVNRPREPLNRETIKNFEDAFLTEGFIRCSDGKWEDGFEKLALYVNDSDIPKHAARLLPNGAWTSKMGDSEDIEHDTVHVVEGDLYGKAKVFFKRPNPLCQKPSKLTTFLLSLRRIFGMR